jgi:flavin reductase (DIM6/NTAB) family NADH-FMN oxidoreductase RutF
MDGRRLRDVFGLYMTGVAIVAARDESGDVRAFTANSFVSVSLSPPLVSFCIARTAASHLVFSACDRFAVSILNESQEHLSRSFSSDVDRRALLVDEPTCLSWPPVAAGALAQLICRRYAVHEAGDHSIVVGEGTFVRSSRGQPLGYFRGAYVTAQSLGQDFGRSVSRRGEPS